MPIDSNLPNYKHVSRTINSSVSDQCSGKLFPEIVNKTAKKDLLRPHHISLYVMKNKKTHEHCVHEKNSSKSNSPSTSKEIVLTAPELTSKSTIPSSKSKNGLKLGRSSNLITLQSLKWYLYYSVIFRSTI